jgi:Cdc6-like AAA superfamily ATPase
MSERDLPLIPSEVPFRLMPSSSPRFVGRHEELESLRDFFSQRDESSGWRRTCVLHGVGGIGKTQVCLTFVEQNKRLYVHPILTILVSQLMYVAGFGKYFGSMLLTKRPLKAVFYP